LEVRAIIEVFLRVLFLDAFEAYGIVLTPLLGVREDSVCLCRLLEFLFSVRYLAPIRVIFEGEFTKCALNLVLRGVWTKS
jgi:hypothetical protein